MDKNFEGADGAHIRKLCKQAPKFGNDDDYVDTIVADVYESYLALLPDYRTDREGKGPIGCGYTMSTSILLPMCRMDLMWELLLMDVWQENRLMKELRHA